MTGTMHGSTTTAGDATRTILRDLWSLMQANEDGTRRGLETAHLHDFRVSLRRTRTILSRLPGVLPQDEREHFAAEFKWLGAVTSPVRDFDVFLEVWPNYAAGLPDDLDLAPLRLKLQRRRQQEQADLVENLESEPYRELKADWRDFLDRDPSSWADAPDAKKPVLEVASTEIWRSFEGSLERAAAITDTSPDEDFHELRKDLKKLRYLLEFFHDLYPAGEIDDSIAALKSLQDILGEINDLAVQRQIVRDLVPEEIDDEKAPVQRLLSFIEASLQQLRRQFPDAFSTFGSDEVKERFRLVLRPTT